MSEKPRPRPTTPEEEGIELHPDSWRRFEETFDKVVKAPPVQRIGKPTVANRVKRKRAGLPGAKSSR